MQHTPDRFTLLRRDGVALVVQHLPTGLPTVLHWGRDPGPVGAEDLGALALAASRQTPPGTLDAAWQLSLLPVESDGWAGRPGLLLRRGTTPVLPRWTVTGVDEAEHAVRVSAQDPTAGLRLESTLALTAGGVVTVDHTVTATGDAEVEVVQVEATLPVPRTADHLTTFSGRWTREKAPLTVPMPRGATTRQTRRGRSGHDSPHVTIASTGVLRDRAGEVWAVHLGWSADVTHRVDRMTDEVTLLGAGELLRAGEVRLAPGESYATPTTYFAWSDAGLDGLSARFHTMLRARPQHPAGPRPLVLNTWEAVYFDHDPQTLLRLAERAADVGVERFVLDDGWFRGRRDDRRGLGDWFVDRTVWPDGLEPLARRVHELGMQFGLWFEPEMVNLDSDLARAHPEWLLHAPDRVEEPAGVSWRQQHVLDLAEPAAYEYVRECIGTLVRELGIDFIKWDHNRDLVDATHRGRPGTHDQTRAAYRLIAQLKREHPGLEIESCSSGGARTDLGILAVTDRVWASDSNDAVERQDIQRWTQLLLPPELVGGHVGPTESHSSGRTLDLSFRAATSLMGSAGFEWDLLSCTDEELQVVRAFAALYKEVRHVLHTGTAVHADVVDPALRVVGAVLPDRSEGVWTVATVATLEEALPERVRLHGLDPDRRYRVRVRTELGLPRHGWITPGWVSAGEVTLPGALLASAGLQIPTLWPAQALVLHATVR
ncbi:alpha-galactosidase [Cellulomonas sp. JZ18]|uniref:alpha-galactosidase n=1 Tax=Cellulomonas sp. JZ18 TaxID=2654191 RepID=UPI0012D45892|nr:alpha-galactosidase [Cellulomonas sp. JZ18]QGQ19053.1 alpha-galactosidase [Cellulomonas sp. JZ18]